MGSYVKRAIIINTPQHAPLEATPECEGSAVSPTLASSAFGLRPLELNHYFYLNLVSAIFGGKASLELNKFNFKLRF
jgi:hypothetical protein